MSTEKPIEVKRMTYTVPAAVTGKDEQGRTTIICPHCDDDAYIDPSDGRVVCPTGEAISSVLAAALPELEAFYDTSIMFPGLDQDAATARLREALGIPEDPFPASRNPHRCRSC
jgi:hypothetical protein